MFRANSGARIVISPTSKDSSRVWLEVPVGGIGDEISGYNVLEVSIEVADLEKAIERWKADRVMSHA